MTDEVDERLAELERQVEGAVAVAKDARQTVAEQHDRIEELEAEVQTLREANDRLRDRTELLKTVRQNAARSAEDRAATLVQTLYNEAWRKRKRGREPVAEMNKEAAKKALGGSTYRQQIYRTFETAVNLVDDETVLEYKQPPRSSEQQYRLRLNLDAGELPEMVAGHEIEPPVPEGEQP